MRIQKFGLNALLSLVAAAALTACGGGGGGDSAPPATIDAAAQGVYGGALSGDTKSSAFQLLLLENGEYWSMYGIDTGSMFYVAGFVQGSGFLAGTVFTSTDGRDFGFSPAVGGTLSATVNTSVRTIAGRVTAGNANVNFSGGAIPGSLYNYNTAASVSTVSGAWTLTSLSGAGVSLNIASDGAFTATSQGCAFNGKVVPRPSGQNVFNVSMTFGAAPCELPGQAASGIAVAVPLTGGKTQLIVAAVNGGRQYGTAAFGVR